MPVVDAGEVLYATTNKEDEMSNHRGPKKLAGAIAITRDSSRMQEAPSVSGNTLPVAHAENDTPRDVLERLTAWVLCSNLGCINAIHSLLVGI